MEEKLKLSAFSANSAVNGLLARRLLSWVGQRLQSPPRKDFLKLVDQSFVNQSIRGQHLAAVELEGAAAKSVTRPPASWAISTPAAVSHGFRLNSQNPSILPQAT